ncbi:hypothetical protein HPP92_019442 [Vanilla planifolia]|uniref:Secreted protein n=1 Tax=Vanilla planifolia TaxID=51239 RepID=A0A835UKY4_VANPL|nr:hypothetical protein HPP92_019442 [Vanilla planifolia]
MAHRSGVLHRLPLHLLFARVLLFFQSLMLHSPFASKSIEACQRLHGLEFKSGLGSFVKVEVKKN